MTTEQQQIVRRTPYIETELDYVDCECIDEQDKRINHVSGFMAGRAFNDLCKMIGGRWPDARMQEEAPEAYAFFMKLFDA